MSRRGFFIAFEGGEGAGKSTQIGLLAEEIGRRGGAPLVTREPGGTPGGQALRRLLLTDEGRDWTAEAEALLMMTDRAQHVARVVRPALEAGRLVLSDRYVGSTLAYQGAGRGLPVASILATHAWSCAQLWPDLTIVLDIDPVVGLARSTRRLSGSASPEDRFEQLELEFHRRVRQGFLELGRLIPGPLRIVSAERSVNAVQQEIREILQSLGYL